MKRLRKKFLSMEQVCSKYHEIDKRYSSRSKKYSILVHANIRYLCAILGLTPEKIIQEYLDSFAFGYKSDATKKQRDLADKFFLSCRTEKSDYDRKEIKQMLKEMEINRSYFSRSFSLGIEASESDVFHAGRNIFNQKWVQWWFNKHRNHQKISLLDEI
ncbi:hypothetical protein [Sphingobacterium endophyticum]|uniref:hypothetical protein n=1 Tax=Sphingobacterium endophyticum TaxID=2546448 RepID=UPI0012E3023B|nr:hypothetical protein [Sphingobacterium endophyticum]